jgi:hypothetical protein
MHFRRTSHGDAIIRCVNHHLLLLAFCQGLFLTNNVTFVAINGLVGLSWRRSDGWPPCRSPAYVVGAALSAMPVSRLQARVGRKRSFQIGLLVGAGASATVRLRRGVSELRTAAAVHAGGGLLQRQRGLVPFRRPRAGGAEVQGDGGVHGAGGGVFGAPSRAEPGQLDPRLAVRTVCRAPTWRWSAWLHGVAGGNLADPLPAACRAAARSVHGAASERDRSAAGVHRRGAGGGPGLRRDEPADGSDADRDAAVQAPVRQRRTGAGVACAGHVRAELLHRAPHPALRRAAGHGGGRGPEPRVHRRGAVGCRPDAVPGGAVRAGRGLELPLHRRHHAADRDLPARKRRTRPRVRWTPASSRR